MADRAAIVGAGLAGSLLALFLARRGHRVEVFERRGDPRAIGCEEGRSINLGLSARGIRALRLAGLWERVRAVSVPMRGRMVHPPSGPPFFQPYGRDPGQILYSIRRDALSSILIDQAEKQPDVRFFFDAQVSGIDRESPALTVSGRGRVEADFVVGADGVSSLVRRAVPGGVRTDVLEWGYKELHLPETDRPQALHVWPGEGALMVAHPNLDGSLTCTAFLPHDVIAALPGCRAIEAFFDRVLPGARELVPDLAGQFAAAPAGQLTTVRATSWHHADRLVLVGDACHAVYPFYGQGMNSSLEDCVVLEECLARHPGDRLAAFADYQRLRKPHTDVLADLSADNFLELRDRLRSPLHLARKHADVVLNRLFPRHWQPLYTMISHTTMPYGQALRRARRQDAVLRAAAGAGLLAGAALVMRGRAART
ncbi:FAD-dependent oxidoreductase [Nonomuraea soli]|uniref:Kynurenine 3-monooxygenase n=1 Tax=Nonomuraea soli TaxID=1032476 RepID=A0A7W0CKT1_9ACTN|nr:NAD(P)/FAD-dependent oxidoreductase [Nonomuraea soli]MBA2892921.1 kynurenine 3-monooxygenase [Nonomuraea soli]